MGIFNIGGIASAYSTGITQKTSFWNKIGKTASDFEKTYHTYRPQNKSAAQSVTSFAAVPIKKNNMLLYIGGGGLALLIVYLIMK